MSISEGSYEITLADERIGSLCVQHSGLYTLFRGRCSIPRYGVHRLCAVSGEKLIPICVPSKEGGFLCIRKSISDSELDHLGIHDPCRFTLYAGSSGWNIHPKYPSFLMKKEAETVLYAVPLNCREPFPLMEIFCFGTPEMINGCRYLVFSERYFLLGTTSIQ